MKREWKSLPWQRDFLFCTKKGKSTAENLIISMGVIKDGLQLVIQIFLSKPFTSQIG